MRNKKQVIIKTVVVLALLFSPAYSVATDENEDSLRSLSDYIHYALSNSASLKAAFESYRAVSQRFPQETALSDPRVSYGYFIRPVETRVGPQRHRIGIAQSFPWFGTLELRGDIVNSEAQAEFNRLLAVKNNLVFEITKTYVELAYLDAAVKTTRESIQLVQSWENVLQERFRTSTGSHSDLVRVQVELGKLEDRVAELEDLGTPLTSALNSLLNRQSEEIIILEAGFLSASSDGNSPPVSYESILEKNPELQMLNSLIAARKSGIALAEKKYFPELTVGLDYTVTGDRDTSGGGEDAVVGMFSLNVPIYWEKNRAAVSEARSRERSLALFKKDKEFQLRSALSRSNFEIRDSTRKISLYKNSLIPKTQESIEASYGAYEAGDAGFLEVIDAEEQLLDFKLTLKRSQADLIIAQVRLQQLGGTFNELQSSSEKNQS